MADSPTTRTLKAVRNAGGMAWVVERFNPHAGPHGVRVDAWGFGDVLAAGLGDMRGALLIQATSASNMANRATKIREECADAAAAWLEAGNHIQVWGWRKYATPVAGLYWRANVVQIGLE